MMGESQPDGMDQDVISRDAARAAPERARAADQPGQAESSSSRRRMLGWLRRAGLALASVGGVAGFARLTSNSAGEKSAPVAHAAHTEDPPSGTRLRRWAMVIDLRYCDGCQSVNKPPQCTLGCIEGHFAPEPMQWIEVYEQELPGGGTQFIPTPCQHCENAPCVNVCPVAATFTSPDGMVLIDQERCIGCRICMEACPYDRRFFNWGEPPIPQAAAAIKYDVQHQAPAQKGTVMKCDFCADKARAGRLPCCAQSCPHKAIYYGDLEEDLATNGRDVVKLSTFVSEHSGYRLKEALGTKPRVFYIPGHGEKVGRSAFRHGRLPTVWPWVKRVVGAVTWKR